MNQDTNSRKPKSKLFFYLLLIVLFTVGSVYGVYHDYTNNYQTKETTTQTNEVVKIESSQLDKQAVETEVVEEVKENSKVHLAAIGDLMFHMPQINSAYDGSSQTYNFNSMFADVKPLLSEADVTLANFETTLGGSSVGYSGYPQFNTPDEVADAIKDAGVDILTTTNNHSLDTRADGLKRTATVLQDKGFEIVGTYAEAPESHFLIYEENDITFAILAYTESTNGLGAIYEEKELNEMINLMTKENIQRDILEAKELDVDFIISFMHWGEEYVREPNETQVDYANFMAEQGVDLILGSHPHVIQSTDTISTGEGETFVVYSMGNFISNQRVETLGQNFARTEDGVIVNVHIEKDYELDETFITDIDFIPTWVYKIVGANDKPIYRVLPIDDFLTDGDISSSFKNRMEQSYEATMSIISTE